MSSDEDDDERPGLVDGYCFCCGKPLGLVAWDAADFVWCKRCVKIDEVYTSPDGHRGGYPVRR